MSSSISTVRRRVQGATIVFLAVIGVSACVAKDDGSGAEVITVAASDSECVVSTNKAETGRSSFKVTNNGSKITEFYVYTQGGRVIGEVENIGPGATRNLLVEIVDPGTYRTVCKPGMVGDGIGSDFVVTGESKSSTEDDAILAEAVSGYIRYVRSQVDTLLTNTESFVQSVLDGDIEGAKGKFAATRIYYERIEPVAESFPDDLDPRIDAREADLVDGEKWTGFHRIEKDLWVEKRIDDKTKSAARQLLKDIQELKAGVEAKDYTVTPVQVAGGAQGLLDEIATTKITGEEDIFSHTDLWDFQANLDGSQAAIASLEKALQERDPELLAKVNKEFAKVEALLVPYRKGDGFISYDKVSEGDRKKLSTAIDALTAQVAKVQEAITKEPKKK